MSFKQEQNCLRESFMFLSEILAIRFFGTPTDFEEKVNTFRGCSAYSQDEFPPILHALLVIVIGRIGVIMEATSVAFDSIG